MNEHSFGRTLRRLVRARLRELLACSADAIARGQSDELHRLRVDVKRLRYNLEFVASLAPGDGSLALELLAMLQERLGELADADTFVRTYRTLLAGVAEGDERRPGVLGLAATADRERERALAAVRALWSVESGAYVENLTAAIATVLEATSPQASNDRHARGLLRPLTT